jgi:hypothetical protein
MEITQEYCRNELHDQFILGGFDQEKNIPQLMTDSW